MQQTITQKKVIIGFLASALLVIFGLYIISRANVLADTITLDLNTLVPLTKPDPKFNGPLDPRVEYVNPSARFTSVQTIIGTVFSLVISIGGGIFVLLLLVGGVIYLTGAGNDEQTGKAKKMMIDAIIGLFIILASWGIGTWVLNTFQAKTTIETNGGNQPLNTNGSINNPNNQIDKYSNGINPTTPESVINGNNDINPTSPDSNIVPDGTINNLNPDRDADAMTGSIEIDANNNVTPIGGNKP